MSENVIKLKLEGEEPPPQGPGPAPSSNVNERYAPTLDDMFGVPRTEPTAQMKADAERQRIVAAELYRRQEAEAGRTGKEIGKAVSETIKESPVYKIHKDSRQPFEDEFGQSVTFAAKRSNARNASREYAAQIIADVERSSAGSAAKKTASLMDDTAEMKRLQRFMTAGIGTQNMLGGGGMGQKVSGGLQVAASGLLGEGAAAMAGGPVGLAVMAAALLNDVARAVIAKPFEELRGDLLAAGQAAKSLAGNDGFGMVATVADRTADKLDNLGLGGKLAAEGLKTLSTTMRVYNETVGAFTARGKELSGYNPLIAQAQAQADVRRLMSDVSEANKLGEKYAKLIESQSKMDARLQEALLPLKEKLITFLDKSMPAIEAGVTGLVVTMDAIAGSVELIQKLVGLYVRNSLTGQLLLAALEAIEKNTRKDTEDRTTLYQGYDDLLADLDKLDLTPPKRDPDIGRADRMLKLPAFSL